MSHAKLPKKSSQLKFQLILYASMFYAELVSPERNKILVARFDTWSCWKIISWKTRQKSYHGKHATNLNYQNTNTVICILLLFCEARGQAYNSGSGWRVSLGTWLKTTKHCLDLEFENIPEDAGFHHTIGLPTKTPLQRCHPPTTDEYCKRANYQAAIMRSSLKTNITAPSPVGCGGK